MVIRILFYKSKFGDGHWIDNAISAYTGLFNWGTKNYSHCEIWKSDENGRFTMSPNNSPMDYWGTCYTSTMRGDNNGVVKRPASEVLKNPGRWDYYEVEVGREEYETLVEYMELNVRNTVPYGKKTILQFFNPIEKLRVIDKTNPICSGRVKAWLMWSIRRFSYSWNDKLDSPRRLSKRLEKMGYKAVPLV